MESSKVLDMMTNSGAYIEEEIKLIRTIYTKPCTNVQVMRHPDDCRGYHQPSSRRRDPFQLPTYLPTRCPGCTKGDQCTLAHNREETRYHPLIFGTQLRNSLETCKGLEQGCPYGHDPALVEKRLAMKQALYTEFRQFSGISVAMKKPNAVHRTDKRPGIIAAALGSSACILSLDTYTQRVFLWLVTLFMCVTFLYYDDIQRSIGTKK